MFANYATDKGFISKIYKQLLQVNIGTCLDSHPPQSAAHVPINTASCEELRSKVLPVTMRRSSPARTASLNATELQPQTLRAVPWCTSPHLSLFSL